MTVPNAGATARSLTKGEGRRVWALGSLFTWKANGPDTEDRWELVEIRGRRGSGAPVHVHHRQTEGFYMLEGEATYYLDGRETPVSAGGFALVPPGTRHAFVIESKEARMLAIISPAGLVRFFDELGTETESEELPPADLPLPDPQAIEAAGQRSGQSHYGPVPSPRTPP